MHLDHAGALLLFAALLGRAFARLRDGDAAFFGDGAHRFREVGFVHLHQEFENVAAGAAAEAVVDLLDGVDREGRRFLGMKWAEADEILAALFQAHVFADHADDVRLLFDAIGEGACFSHADLLSLRRTISGGKRQYSTDERRALARAARERLAPERAISP